jgi:hypothetical protein
MARTEPGALKGMVDVERGIISREPSPPCVHARRSAVMRNEVQPCGTYFFVFFVIVNFAPETPRLQPEPVPASASETSPFVSA